MSTLTAVTNPSGARPPPRAGWVWLAGWAGVNALGWPIALAAGFGLAPLLRLTTLHPYLERVSVVAILFLCGGILGAFQWAAVRRVIEEPLRWIPATAIGIALPATPLLLPDLSWPAWQEAKPVIAGLAMLLALVCPGVAQYRVLRTEVGGAGQWFFTSLAGLFLLALGTGAYRYSWLGPVILALSTLFYSALTGWTMYRLTRVRAEMWAEARASAGPGP